MNNDLYNEDYVNLGGNHIHKTAIIGENVKLGFGNVIMANVVIGEAGFIRGIETKGSVVIGDNNKIGVHTTIMSGKEGETSIGDDNLLMNFVNVGHDCKIGDRCEIGAGVILTGFVSVGNESKIKIGAIIKNRIKIGARSLIAMGSVVLDDVEPGKTVMGHPAK